MENMLNADDREYSEIEASVSYIRDQDEFDEPLPERHRRDHDKKWEEMLNDNQTTSNNTLAPPKLSVGGMTTI